MRDVLAPGKLATGKDRRPFFDRYVFGAEMPPLKKVAPQSPSRHSPPIKLVGRVQIQGRR